MIRITYKSGAVAEYEYPYLKKGDRLIFSNRVESLICNIIRFEKQVKDLTIEECRKLGITSIHTFVDRVVKKENNTYCLAYKDGDYIDITSLVVRE